MQVHHHHHHHKQQNYPQQHLFASRPQQPQWVTPTEQAADDAPTRALVDGIHQLVQSMLSKSRLVRNSYGIELLNRKDILHVHKVLGAGAFSQVSLVSTKRQKADGTPKVYACKHLKVDLLADPNQFRTAASELAYEAHMLAAFDHPHILKIRGWAQNGIASFEEGRHDSFFLLLDVLDETLDQTIDRWSIKNQEASLQQQRHMESLQILREIASALDYIHDRGVIFRDLKPNNIGLLNGHVQVFDFGLSRELPTLDTSQPFEMSGKVGTIRYMAPEVVLHQPYNISADVYSWSMVAYELLTCQKPYQGWTPELHADYVCRRGLRPDASQLPSVDLAVLLQHTWHTDASRRPSLKHCMAQLHLLQEKHRLLMEEQRLLQHQQRQRWELQQHQQQQRLQQQQQQQEQEQEQYTVDLNMSFFNQYPPRKLRSRLMDDSLGTIGTESLGTDSLRW